jgi:hypothetical protein
MARSGSRGRTRLSGCGASVLPARVSSGIAVAKRATKREEISITEAELRLLREHLGEDVDLIEGARVHARGDVRISLNGDEMEELLDCVAEAARFSESRKTESRLEMLGAKLEAYWEGYFYEPGQE